MRRALSIAALILALFSRTVEAVTVQDIIDLTRAGLGEDVLLALIEVDGGVFAVDAATLTSLKKAGVSERVIEAMVRSGRSRVADSPPPLPEPEPMPPPQPQVIVIEHERPVVEQVPVAVPVYIAWPVGSRRAYGRPSVPFDPSPGFGAEPPLEYRQPKPQPPVYWGWGGKLRPDAWKPAPEPAAHSQRNEDGKAPNPPRRR